MGVLGGVYVYKVENGEIDYGNDDSSVLQLVFTICPVKCINCLKCFGPSNKNEAKDLFKEPKAQQENNDEQNAWIKKVDFCMGICAIGVSALVTMAYYHNTSIYRNNAILSYALPHCFVVALIGMCLDRDGS